MKWNSFIIYSSLIFFLALLSCNNTEKYQILANELYADKNTFIGSENCKSCHQKEFESWQNSHHDLSMQVADNTSVLGNFNNVVFESKGITYNFFKKENDFYVNTEGIGGNYQDYKITEVFGITPLQQYLINFPDGRKQCLNVAWDTKINKWYDLNPI